MIARCERKYGEWCGIGVIVVALVLGSIVALACSKSANAADAWSTSDKVTATAALGLTLYDWAQTREIAQNPDRWYEKNPLLGRHPSESDVDRHFALSIAAAALVGHLLPTKYREAFFVGIALVEFKMVRDNYELGIRVDF